LTLERACFSGPWRRFNDFKFPDQIRMKGRCLEGGIKGDVPGMIDGIG
jgi:hypothetical protein